MPHGGSRRQKQGPFGLEARCPFFALLSSEDHLRFTSNQEALPASVSVHDSEDYIYYLVQQCSMLAAGAWLSVRFQYLDPSMLIAELKPEQSNLYEKVTQETEQQLLKFMTNETKSLRRTDPSSLSFQSQKTEKFSALGYQGLVIKARNTHLFRRLVVQCGAPARNGILRTMISSKKLTSTHTMALVEFDDESFDFITVSSRQSNIVPAKPLQQASVAHFEAVSSRHTLDARTRAFQG